MTDYGYAFRRRCGWCAVQLRGWQLNLCRRCKLYCVTLDMPSPPCPSLSRRDAEPDRALLLRRWGLRITRPGDTIDP